MSEIIDAHFFFGFQLPTDVDDEQQVKAIEKFLEGWSESIGSIDDLQEYPCTIQMCGSDEPLYYVVVKECNYIANIARPEKIKVQEYARERVEAWRNSLLRFANRHNLPFTEPTFWLGGFCG